MFVLNDGDIDPEHLVHITPGDGSAPEPNLHLFLPTSSSDRPSRPAIMTSPLACPHRMAVVSGRQASRRIKTPRLPHDLEPKMF